LQARGQTDSNRRARARRGRSALISANKRFKLVNELCAEAGVTARYPNIAESSGAIGGIRSDQFYGQTLTAAIRNYLEHRKASGFGAAGLNEIYLAVRDGG
jgi:hypothetical protein